VNGYLFAASLLSFFLGLAHSLRGEWIGKRLLVRTILKLRLFEREDKDILSKRVLRVAWHVPSITWCGLGSLLMYLALADAEVPTAIVRIVAITFFASFAFSVITVRGKHPSWVLFLLISILAWLGAR